MARKHPVPKIIKRLGVAIRSRREQLGFSQEAFADECGVARSYYGRIERGEIDIRVSTLEILSKVLKMPTHKLVYEAQS